MIKGKIYCVLELKTRRDLPLVWKAMEKIAAKKLSCIFRKLDKNPSRLVAKRNPDIACVCTDYKLEEGELESHRRTRQVGKASITSRSEGTQSSLVKQAHSRRSAYIDALSDGSQHRGFRDQLVGHQPLLPVRPLQDDLPSAGRDCQWHRLPGATQGLSTSCRGPPPTAESDQLQIAERIYCVFFMNSTRSMDNCDKRQDTRRFKP